MSGLLGHALKGVGDAMREQAIAKRDQANRLLQIETQAEATASARARHRAPQRSGSSKQGGRKALVGLNNTQSDNLARLYKGYVDGGSFDGEAPPLAQFEVRVEEIMSKENVSLASASERARSEWGHREVTSQEDVPRNIVGRLIHGEETKTVDRTNLVGGFGAALGEVPSERKPSADAQNPPSNEVLAQARSAINAGADPVAVKNRLREMGIDPEGL